MKQYDYRPFHDNYLDAAAHLLAARHQYDRTNYPALTSKFTDSVATRQAIAAQWQQPYSSGVAAFDGDALVGYLIGYMQVDQYFGRAIWSRLAGHGVAPGIATDLYCDLYAAAAPHWLTWGCFEHLTLVPATAAYLEPWALLGFGRMHAYALQSLTDRAIATTPPAQLTIRRAAKGDAEHLRTMAFLTADELQQAPTWALTPPETRSDRSNQYAAIVEDEEVTCWLAFVGEEAVGFQAWYPADADADALDIPEQAVELAAAGVHVAWRGQGISRALTTHALVHAQTAGYRYAIANWRTTNLTAARTWPRLGFSTVTYRLHRHVDERILWGQLATGQSDNQTVGQ